LIDLLASNKVRNLLRQQVRIFKSVYCWKCDAAAMIMYI
jgi:hypothetical protein